MAQEEHGRTAAKAMKVRTAASERVDSRASPQTPWPDVQPEPSAVPTPTSSPASAIPGSESGTVCERSPPARPTKSGAASKPATKAMRHDRSPPSTAPVVMPEMPAMRPKKSITRTADSPIRTPPKSEAQGVNSVATAGSMTFLPLDLP